MEKMSKMNDKEEEEERDVVVYVGTDFGDSVSPVGKVLCYRLDESRKGLVREERYDIGTEEEGQNPGWMVLSEEHNGCFIWMENEEGRVYHYPLQLEDDKQVESVWKTKQSTLGQHPCYGVLVSLKGDDDVLSLLVTVHYTSGNLSVIPVMDQSQIGSSAAAAAAAVMSHADAIPKEEDGYLHDRQESSHMHCVVPHPHDNTLLAVCDLGFSSVTIYQLQLQPQLNNTTTTNAIDVHKLDTLKLRPHDGCRHCVWSRRPSNLENKDDTSNYLYINNELSCTLTIALWDPSTQQLTEISTISVLPNNVQPNRDHHRGNSHIALHPLHPHILYMGIRSSSPHGTIAIVNVSSPQQPIVQSHVSTHGAVPRHFQIISHHNHFYLIVGNQESKTIVLFQVDPNDGTLSYTSQTSTYPYKPCHIASLAACS